MQQPHKSDEQIRQDLERLSSADLERVAQTMRQLARSSPDYEAAVASFLMLIKEILDKRGET